MLVDLLVPLLVHGHLGAPGRRVRDGTVTQPRRHTDGDPVPSPRRTTLDAVRSRARAGPAAGHDPGSGPAPAGHGAPTSGRQRPAGHEGNDEVGASSSRGRRAPRHRREVRRVARRRRTQREQRRSSTASARTRLLTAALAVAAGLAVTVGAAAPPAVAQDLRTSDLGLTTTVGWGRGVSSAHWALVEVTSQPQVPIQGTLELRASGPLGSSVTAVDLEVAAGATKVAHVLLPPSQELQASFRSSDGQQVPVTVPMSASGDVLVGGLGEAPALPDPLSSLATDRAVRAVAIDPAVLRLGPRALESLDALWLDAAELDALDVEERDHLAVAAAQGLDLVVAAPPGTAALGLPWEPLAGPADTDGLVASDAAWSVEATEVGGDGGQVVAAAVGAGRGRVVAVAVAPDDTEVAPELLATLLQPREDVGHAIAGVDSGTVNVGLFGRGANLPGVTGTALFVLLFLLAVGPLHVLLLRRLGRRELGWVTVPVITVVFTAAAIGSAATRAPSTTPTVRAAWWLDGVGQELDAVALQAASRETLSVTLPGRRDAIAFEPWGSTTAATQVGPDATRISVPMQSLQSGTVVAWGTPTVDAPLELAATFDDGSLTVEVTNTSTSALTGLTVEVGTLTRPLGEDLPAGAATTVTFDELDPLPRSPLAQRAFGNVGVDFPGGPPGAGPGDASSALELLRGGVLDESPGTVWVTGTTTDDLGAAPVDAPGTPVDLGTAFAVGATPVSSGGEVLPHQVRRGLLTDPDTGGWRVAPSAVEGAGDVGVRFRLPDPSVAGELVSSLTAGGPLRGGDPWGNGGDPFAAGCFEVTVTTPDGETLPPEEVCGGPEIPCPPEANSCEGTDDGVNSTATVTLPDGSRQVAVRIPEAELPEGDLGGGELWNVRTQRWVPAAEALADDRGDYDDLVNPFGEVLLRIRGGGFLEIAQRGLGVRPGGDA
ncbi:hypothetical protein FTX61_04665 [Nitriliruptoraceae bacterium ZYF776]|nr:hypothetical protein [Profundirhabdus halotolerans]